MVAPDDVRISTQQMVPRSKRMPIRCPIGLQTGELPSLPAGLRALRLQARATRPS